MRHPTRAHLLLSLLLLPACGPSKDPVGPLPEPGEPPAMSKTVNVTTGLYTSPSSKTAPEGALLRADNVVLQRSGVLESRRGFDAVVTGAGTIRSWAAFGERYVVAHVGGTQLTRLDTQDGTSTPYAGDFLPPPGADRVAFALANGSLFFTTAAGVYRLDSPTSEPVLAGAPRAFDGTTELSGTAGFLPAQRGCAYRYCLGKYTEDGKRLILGAASGRVEVYNDEPTDSRNVSHVVTLPSEVEADQGYFLQAYRSADVPLAQSPSDEMRQVYEVPVTAGNLSGDRTVGFEDVDPLRTGGNLYSNPNSGEGALSSRFPPPVSRVLEPHRGYLFFGDVTGVRRLVLNLLGVGMTPGMGAALAVGDTFFFNKGDGSGDLDGDGNSDAFLIVYALDHEDLDYMGDPLNQVGFKVFTDGTPAQNLVNTARSMAGMIAKKGWLLRAFYGGTDSASGLGQVVIEALSPEGEEISVTVSRPLRAIAPVLPTNSMSGSASKDKSTGIVTVNFPASFVSAVSVGDKINVINGGSLPDPLTTVGEKTITSISPGTPSFTFSDPPSGTGIVSQTIFFAFSQPPVLLDTDAAPNGLAYSNLEAPDSVPVTNYEAAGDANAHVRRLLSVGNSLFLLKDDGLFRLTGNNPRDFQIEPWDSTIRFVAPGSALVLGGVAYALSTRGFVSWTEASRPQPTVGLPVEQTIRTLLTTLPAEVAARAHSVAYESDNALLFWLPTTEDQEQCPGQAYRFNTLTRAWTRWTQCADVALVQPGSDKLLLSGYLPSWDSRAVLVEKKTGTSADYQDMGADPIPVDVAFLPDEGGAPGVGKLWSVVGYNFVEAPPTEATAYFSTDVSPAPLFTPVLGANATDPGVLETMVDLEHARSQSLTVGIRHAVAGEPFRLEGYSLRYRAYSTVTSGRR